MLRLGFGFSLAAMIGVLAVVFGKARALPTTSVAAPSALFGCQRWNLARLDRIGVLAAFRAYRSLSDSVADHAQPLQDVGLYRQALQVVSDPDEFARRIAQAGYSNDPSYAAKLINLMHQDDLYRLDAPPSR